MVEKNLLNISQFSLSKNFTFLELIKFVFTLFKKKNVRKFWIFFSNVKAMKNHFDPCGAIKFVKIY